MTVSETSTPCFIKRWPRRLCCRYSVDSCPPSPDPNDSLDKSGLDEDDDDDEFSDGGHYKSPGRYDDHDHHPHHPHHRPSYMPDGSYDNGDRPSSPPEREMAKPGGFPSSLDRMEIMKRRFFEHYLKMGGGHPAGVYPMEYPLRSFPPHHPPPPLPPRARDFSAGATSSAAEAHDVFDSRHGMKAEGLDACDSQRTSPGNMPHYMRRPYGAMRSFMEQQQQQLQLQQQQQQQQQGSGERHDLNARMAMLAGRVSENQRSDGPVSPKREQNASFSPPGKDMASSTSTSSSSFFSAAAAVAAAQSGAEQGGRFSPPHRDPSTLSVKREPGQLDSPEGSPANKSREGGMQMPPASSTSSPLTKIPIPPALTGHQGAHGRGSFHGELPPLHEMMLAQGMVAPGSRLPMMPHLGPSGAPPESAPQGHLYFCHLCSYSGEWTGRWKESLLSLKFTR